MVEARDCERRDKTGGGTSLLRRQKQEAEEKRRIELCRLARWRIARLADSK